MPVQMSEIFQRIFLLRLSGVQRREISEELRISEPLLNELTGSDAFVALQKILCEAMLGEIDYDPVTSARHACSEIDTAQIRREVATANDTPAHIRLKAVDDLENRGYGKPMERILQSGGLDREMRAKEKEIKGGMEELEEVAKA